MNVKQELLKKCNEFVNNRLQTVQETISSNQKALSSETKSSAGDKHETGRAMLQLEMEKSGKQLSSINEMKIVLSKIDILNNSNLAHLGSIVETSFINYFLSISAGKIQIENQEYFAVSVSSPIGKLLLGKKEGEQIALNNKLIEIIKVN